MSGNAFDVGIPLGAMLGGKYRVDKVLGQGGMGSVLLAENVQIGRMVAIKVLHGNFATDEQVLARFRMEARATAAIGHPGIVDVLDLGTTDDGSEFIVMERLEGETLGGRIKRLGSLTPEEVIPIVASVLDALGAAHDKGVVHRDLKPENIFLVEKPVVGTKILDFGISKFKGAEDVSLTQTGTVMGSPLYMSPEQARGAKDIGPATDLYSIGAILYEALTGEPPFMGDSFNAVMASLLMDTHKPVRERKPEVSPALSAIVDRLLSKSVAERPPSARAAKELLERALQPGDTDIDMPAATQPSGPSSTAAKRVRMESAATTPDLRPPVEVQGRRILIGSIVFALLLVGAALVVAVQRRAAAHAGSIAVPAAVAAPVAAPAVVTPPPVAEKPAEPAQKPAQAQAQAHPGHAAKPARSSEPPVEKHEAKPEKKEKGSGVTIDRDNPFR